MRLFHLKNVPSEVREGPNISVHLLLITASEFHCDRRNDTTKESTRQAQARLLVQNTLLVMWLALLHEKTTSGFLQIRYLCSMLSWTGYRLRSLTLQYSM